MKNRNLFILFFITIFGLIQISSCKKELKEPDWDIDVLAPLARATLTVDNIYNDSTKKVNSDNSISLVYSSGLYNFTLDTLFKIPDTTISYTAKLSNIDLGIIDITHRTSLGDIANKDLQDNGPNSNLYQSIMNAHTSGTPTVIDPITEQVFDSLEIDASQYFQTATLSNGFLDIKITNDLPISISNLVFQVRNISNNQVLIQDTFPFIPSNTFVQKTKSLAGLTLEGHMLGFVKISSPGSGGMITLDTIQAFTTQIIIRDLAILSAVANFPGQNIVDIKEKTSFTIQDVQLSKVIVRSGNIIVDVYNTLYETLHFKYKVHSATKNGIPLEIIGDIPPASGGNASHIIINKGLQGYEINMKGIGPIEQTYNEDLDGNGINPNPDTVNTIYSVLTGSIDSSGNQIPLSLQDSIYFNCSFTNLVPDYVLGYLGKDTISESGTVEMNMLTELEGASLDFNDVKVSMVVNNQIGINAQVKINLMDAVNTYNNQSALLTVSQTVNPFTITKPNNPFSLITDVVPTYNVLQLNNTNSNINHLINLIPNKFTYSVQIFTNPNLIAPAFGTGTDFIYYGDKINATIDIEVPLSVIASNIMITDTTDFSLGKTNINQILGGNLLLFTDNEFPIEASPQIYLLDSLNNELEKIIPLNAIVEAGLVNETTGRVSVPKRSKITVLITPARLEFLKKTKKIRIIASFVTRSQAMYVKIYNDYTMKFKLVGDFNYKLH